MPWHHPQNPSLCQSQSDNGSAGEVGRPWGHTSDGTSCRPVRCGARRRWGAMCLQGTSERSVPGEVRHSLGEPSWRCHPHPCLLLRSLLRHTAASAATRPRLCSAPTCLWQVTVCVHKYICVQLNVKLVFYAPKPCHTKAISFTEADDRKNKIHRVRDMHMEWDYCKMHVEVHGSSVQALCLFQAVLMTNERSIFPQSSRTPVKAELILLGL